MSIDWRRFTFFTRIDGCSLPAVVPQSATFACSRALVFFGDETGTVHVMDESYGSNAFIAHGGAVHQVQAVAQRDILVSIGSSANNDKIELKVWSIEPSFAQDAQHQPRLLHQRQFDAESVVSALALHANLTHVAIGLANGKVLLLKDSDYFYIHLCFLNQVRSKK